MKKAKTRKRNERRILLTVIILALLIVAGGTFAWFTSKDEVTNKLSAEQKYNVSITETFTTPSSWVPGQEVNKDVNLVNTGNIDAFVKMSLNSSIVVTVAGETDTFSADDAIVLYDDEVQSLMAGGDLVYAVDELVTDRLPSTDFDPEETGIYVFERTVKTSDNGTVYSYAGFYFVKGATADEDKYYALASITADKDADGNLSGFTASYAIKETKDAADMVHTYDADNNKIVAKTADGNIIINILLDENELPYWTVVDGEFYFNETLAPGATTMKTSDTGLVTAVQLDSSVSEDAYLSFDYNLTVKSDSVQAIPSKAGKFDEMSASTSDFAAEFTANDDTVAGHSEGGEFKDGVDENGNYTAIKDFEWK